MGLVAEVALNENRVALVPGDVATLVKEGFEVHVARGAGERASIYDSDYIHSGASIVEPAEAMQAEIVVSVSSLDAATHQTNAATSLNAATHQATEQHFGVSTPCAPGTHCPLIPNAVFIGMLDPMWKPERSQRLAEASVSAFSLDMVPRITRAQSMDVLSSMATIAGYEAVLLAASTLPQMFPLMMTAGGTLSAARVLVLGAGVAGLQAIATARRLGAVVEAYDIRPAALEQIRSMGARAIEIDLHKNDENKKSTGKNEGNTSNNAGSERSDGYASSQSERTATRQQEMLTEYVAAADVIITTAAIPGRTSPLLLTHSMVEAMRAGSVIIDIAAERGGNCALTEADTTIFHNGVTVLGPTYLTSQCARHASQMFSSNLTAFLLYASSEGQFTINLDDEIIAAMLVTHNGSILKPQAPPKTQTT